MAVITTALLDELRHEGDPPADAAVGAVLRAGRSPAYAFRGLVDRSAPLTPELAEFVATASPLPTWLDADLLAAGVDFFDEWGVEIGLALFCCALPIGYAAGPVAHVLDLTARLETDARRRVFETAQMVLDVTTPGGLEPGRPGHTTALQVRLMHAAVRHLVEHDPRVRRTCADVDEPHWCPEWGTPLSQEHLLGALLAFGYAMVRALDTLGLDYDERGAAGYLHLWSVVGHLMGIRPDVLPVGMDEARRAYDLLERRDVAATAAGRRLTQALVSLLDDCGPARVLRGLPVATMRALLGDDLADVVGLPRAGWQRHVLTTVRPLIDGVGAAGAHDRLVRATIRRFTRTVMVAFVQTERRGGRPPFTVPEHLAVDFLPRAHRRRASRPAHTATAPESARTPG
jgi:hypothetical protein